MSHPAISVLVPCYNEAAVLEDSIGRLVAALEGCGRPFEIVACDDGSTDDTRSILEALAQRHPALRVTGYTGNRGAGHAMRTAAAAARGEILMHMDADLAIEPAHAIPACLTALADHDLVFCSRYGGVRADYPLYRRLPSLAYRLLYRRALGISVGDAMSGFFALHRRTLIELGPLTADGFELYLELAIKAQRRGLRIAEVPIAFRHQRLSGEFSVLRDGPRQLLRTVRLWRQLAQ